MFNFTVSTDLNSPDDHPGDRSPESIYRRHLAACAEVRRLSALTRLGADEALDSQHALALEIHYETRKALIDLIDAAPASTGESPDITWTTEPESDEWAARAVFVDGVFLSHMYFGDDYLAGLDPAPALARAGFKIVPM
jgi:hypothetical protein